MNNAGFPFLGSRILLFPVLFLAATAAGQTNLDEATGRFFPFERLRPDEWSRHIRLGAVAGFNTSASFRLGGNLAISGSTVPGVYDDGYVLVDDTGNAGGYTANWGYESASQLSGNTLTFSRSTSFSASETSRKDDDVSLGLELAYGDTYWRWGDARIGWEASFGWMPLTFTDNRTMPAALNRTLYPFSTGGIVVPAAPYHGTAVSAGAPSILDTPSGSLGSAAVAGILAGSRKIDVSLFTFKLGPSICFGLSRRLGLYTSAGPALGFVTGDYNYSETLSVGSATALNQGRIGFDSVVYGGYVSAVLAYNIPSERADIFFGAQYMPLGSATVSGGGREARLDLSGQVSISAGINWAF